MNKYANAIVWIGVIILAAFLIAFVPSMSPHISDGESQEESRKLDQILYDMYGGLHPDVYWSEAKTKGGSLSRPPEN